MAESVVKLGSGGFQSFEEMAFGTSDPVEISRLTKPSYDEQGLGYFFADDGPRPFIDEEGYRVNLNSPTLTEFSKAGEYEGSVEKVSPYAGMADPQFPMDTVTGLEMLEQGNLFPKSVEGRTGMFVPSRVTINDDGTVNQVPIGFEDGGEVDLLSKVSDEDKRRILRVGNENIGDLRDIEFEIFSLLTDNQRKGIQNFEDGGSPMFEEAGILTGIFNAPNTAAQDIVRQSGRQGSEGSAMFYPEGAPTFEQMLEQEYGYPDVPRAFDEAEEDVRNERPRFDMPTFQELEDARAHALMAAELGREFGPETALKMGGIQEYMDEKMFFPIGGATPEDSDMDRRNNAFGISLLKKAGIESTPQQIAQMVDQEIFNQLDRILDRKSEEKSFKSPEGGIDVYFPRDNEGYFATMKKQYR